MNYGRQSDFQTFLDEKYLKKNEKRQYSENQFFCHLIFIGFFKIVMITIVNHVVETELSISMQQTSLSAKFNQRFQTSVFTFR